MARLPGRIIVFSKAYGSTTAYSAPDWLLLRSGALFSCLQVRKLASAWLISGPIDAIVDDELCEDKAHAQYLYRHSDGGFSECWSET